LNIIAHPIPQLFELSDILDGKFNKRYLHLLVTSEQAIEAEQTHYEAHDTLSGLPENRRMSS
jgi:hypothetical protein